MRLSGGALDALRYVAAGAGMVAAVVVVSIVARDQHAAKSMAATAMPAEPIEVVPAMMVAPTTAVAAQPSAPLTRTRYNPEHYLVPELDRHPLGPPRVTPRVAPPQKVAPKVVAPSPIEEHEPYRDPCPGCGRG